MAVRNDFTAGEVLAAADLNDTFASKLPYSYGTATPSTTDSGFLWYDSNSTPAAPKFWDGAAFQALTSGKILQVVRTTDSTDRATTSTSYVDVTGMTVTITPTKSTSAILIVAAFRAVSATTATLPDAFYQITDSSNNDLSGEGRFRPSVSGNLQHWVSQVMIGYATPATTSAVTYKLRHKVGAVNQTCTIQNASQVGQMYALEISA